MSDSEIKESGGRYGIVIPGARDSVEYSIMHPALEQEYEKYRKRHKLTSPPKNHLIDYGGVVIADPKYYPSKTVRRIVSLANKIIDQMVVPGGRKFSRMAGVARAVGQLMPYDFETEGVRADKHEELTEMDENIGLLTVCRHQAPATVAALAKIGFNDAVLVIHDWRNEPTPHALAFVPSRGMFVCGTSARIYPVDKYLDLPDEPYNFVYGYYPKHQTEAGRFKMKFKPFSPQLSFL